MTTEIIPLEIDETPNAIRSTLKDARPPPGKQRRQFEKIRPAESLSSATVRRCIRAWQHLIPRANLQVRMTRWCLPSRLAISVISLLPFSRTM